MDEEGYLSWDCWNLFLYCKMDIPSVGQILSPAVETTFLVLCNLSLHRYLMKMGLITPCHSKSYPSDSSAELFITGTRLQLENTCIAIASRATDSLNHLTAMTDTV